MYFVIVLEEKKCYEYEYQVLRAEELRAFANESLQSKQCTSACKV
jgi:hypothetical protein